MGLRTVTYSLIKALDKSDLKQVIVNHNLQAEDLGYRKLGLNNSIRLYNKNKLSGFVSKLQNKETNITGSICFLSPDEDTIKIISFSSDKVIKDPNPINEEFLLQSLIEQHRFKTIKTIVSNKENKKILLYKDYNFFVTNFFPNKFGGYWEMTLNPYRLKK